MIRLVHKAIWLSVYPMPLYKRETTVPPKIKLGKPMANHVEGIQRKGFFEGFCCIGKRQVFSTGKVLAK